jgi:uncharacterized membrane protein
MSDEPHSDIQALRVDVARLTRRVEELEHAVLTRSGAPSTPPARVRAPEQAWQEPERAAPAPGPVTVPAPAARAPRPERPPVDWGKVAERLFTARTLAWAGGVATALGIALLFVMAASRGWVTPPMRVGLGVLVSLVMLAAALELDRRRWRADAILAAAGAGVAGLYASLWAAASVYGFFGAPVASPLAALIAALAVAVAIRIRREPLAVFGISAAMVAPVLIDRDVTGPGVLFASIMLAATLPLYHRLRWRRLATAAWAAGFAEAAALLLVSRHHTGFGLPVAAAAVVAALLVCMLFLLELLPADRRSVSPLGWSVATSAFALTLAATFVSAAARQVGGHSRAGLTLLAVTAIWAVLAAVPGAGRRRHAELADLLAAFALAAAATATGLLAGGPALVCAWAAESAVLIAAAERISRRSGVRRCRIAAAAGVYLALATAAALRIVVPTAAHLPHLGAGSWRGTIALAAVAAAAVVFCFGVRWVAHPAKVASFALPAMAIGYLPAWALPADRAVVAYAALAAALLCYRRSPVMVAWLRDEAAIAIAAAWWAAGAVAALAVTAPVGHMTRAGWSGLGAGRGLAGLAALAAAGAVWVWSLRRPRHARTEYALLVPVATAAYLLAEALTVPHAFWAWLAAAAVLAAAVHVPVLRRALRLGPLVMASGAMLALGLVSAWSHDGSLRAILDHGASAGWESIAIATAAALLLATAALDPVRRSAMLWLPYLLAAQLGAMLLSGQYALLVPTALASAASIAAATWPAWLARRLDRDGAARIGAIGALAVSAIVLLGYETPGMLLRSSHTPAGGLAAAVAAAASLALAAVAARRHPSGEPAIGRVRPTTLLTYLAGAAALWTLAAAILGAAQLTADAASVASVHDHFQQGHVAVSISWVLVGLILVVASLRGDRRDLRIGGIALLFVAVAKLFLFDLAFLTAMARAVSFIGTGSVLLVAALLLQRFAPHVKAVLGDDHAGAAAS